MNVNIFSFIFLDRTISVGSVGSQASVNKTNMNKRKKQTE